ncbi:MAG TPA: hypothetical protein VIG69_02400 [Candidatus Methylomirabilis sp.]|jgi:hypothetical protein
MRRARHAVPILLALALVGCQSLIVREDDDPATKAVKVLSRLALGAGTLTYSERQIDSIAREEKTGAMARTTANEFLKALADLAKFDDEIRLMLKEDTQEKIKYRLVLAENYLNQARNRVKLLEVRNPAAVSGSLSLAFNQTLENKAKMVAYLLEREIGAARGANKFANEQIVQILDEILSYTKVNRYIFQEAEVTQIAQARETWHTTNILDVTSDAQGQEALKARELWF